MRSSPRLGELNAIRQLTDTLNRVCQSMQGMAREQKAVAAKLAEMHTDITVMKLQKEEIQALKDVSAEHTARRGVSDILCERPVVVR